MSIDNRAFYHCASKVMAALGTLYLAASAAPLYAVQVRLTGSVGEAIQVAAMPVLYCAAAYALGAWSKLRWMHIAILPLLALAALNLAVDAATLWTLLPMPPPTPADVSFWLIFVANLLALLALWHEGCLDRQKMEAETTPPA